MISHNLVYDDGEHGISIAGNDYNIESNDLSGNNAGGVQRMTRDQIIFFNRIIGMTGLVQGDIL